MFRPCSASVPAGYIPLEHGERIMVTCDTPILVSADDERRARREACGATEFSHFIRSHSRTGTVCELNFSLRARWGDSHKLSGRKSGAVSNYVPVWRLNVGCECSPVKGFTPKHHFRPRSEARADRWRAIARAKLPILMSWGLRLDQVVGMRSLLLPLANRPRAHGQRHKGHQEGNLEVISPPVMGGGI